MGQTETGQGNCGASLGSIVKHKATVIPKKYYTELAEERQMGQGLRFQKLGATNKSNVVKGMRILVADNIEVNRR